MWNTGNWILTWLFAPLCYGLAKRPCLTPPLASRGSVPIPVGLSTPLSHLPCAGLSCLTLAAPVPFLGFPGIWLSGGWNLLQAASVRWPASQEWGVTLTGRQTRYFPVKSVFFSSSSFSSHLDTAKDFKVVIPPNAWNYHGTGWTCWDLWLWVSAGGGSSVQHSRYYQLPRQGGFHRFLSIGGDEVAREGVTVS